MKTVFAVLAMCSLVYSNAFGAVTWFNIVADDAVTSAAADVVYEYPWSHLSDDDVDDDSGGGSATGQTVSSVDLRNGKWVANSKSIWNCTGSGAFSVYADNDPHTWQDFVTDSDTLASAYLQATTGLSGGNVSVKYYFNLTLNEVQAAAGNYIDDDFGGGLMGPKGVNFTIDYDWGTDKLVVKRYNGGTLVSTTNVAKNPWNPTYTFTITEIVNLSPGETINIRAWYRARTEMQGQNSTTCYVTVVGSL